MKLYDLLEKSSVELTVCDKDYDIETYFYGVNYILDGNESELDKWDESMFEFAKLLDVDEIGKNGVIIVNMSEVIEKNLENIKKADLFINNNIDDIMEGMPNILAGNVSEKWLEKFVNTLKDGEATKTAYEIRHGEATLSASEYKKFNKGELVFGESDGDSEVIATFDTNEEAEKALKNYHCTYEKSSNDLYYIEEYGLIEIDDCECVNIELADEPKTEYVVYDDQLTEVFKTEDKDDAEQYIERAEHEADERGEYISLTIEQRYQQNTSATETCEEVKESSKKPTVWKRFLDKLPEEIDKRLANCRSLKSDIKPLTDAMWEAMKEFGKDKQGYTKEDALVSVLETLDCNSQVFDLTHEEYDLLKKDSSVSEPQDITEETSEDEMEM